MVVSRIAALFKLFDSCVIIRPPPLPPAGIGRGVVRDRASFLQPKSHDVISKTVFHSVQGFLYGSLCLLSPRSTVFDHFNTV